MPDTSFLLKQPTAKGYDYLGGLLIYTRVQAHISAFHMGACPSDTLYWTYFIE
jgi:hypothetical protein